MEEYQRHLAAAPVETASPMTLGKGKFLLYERMEYVPFRNRDNAEPENVDTFTFLTRWQVLGLPTLYHFI